MSWYQKSLYICWITSARCHHLRKRHSILQHDQCRASKTRAGVEFKNCTRDQVWLTPVDKESTSRQRIATNPAAKPRIDREDRELNSSQRLHPRWHRREARRIFISFASKHIHEHDPAYTRSGQHVHGTIRIFGEARSISAQAGSKRRRLPTDSHKASSHLKRLRPCGPSIVGACLRGIDGLSTSGIIMIYRSQVQSTDIEIICNTVCGGCFIFALASSGGWVKTTIRSRPRPSSASADRRQCKSTHPTAQASLRWAFDVCKDLTEKRRPMSHSSG